jgi:hypothetical protein
MLIFVLVLVSLAWVVTLGIMMFGPKRGAPTRLVVDSPKQVAGAAASSTPSLEAELDRRRKELDETRKTNNELKAELKQAKRKLYEAREASKEGSDLAKARAEVERNASLQLDSVRAELAAVLADNAKLREEAEMSRRRPHAQPAPVAAPVVVEAPAPAPVAKEPPKRVIRELSEAEKERLDRAEHVASKERARAGELDREVRRLKGRVETQNRIFLVTKGELELLKDKFKALEKRLNRTLLERELLQRAVKELSAQTGKDAGRTELTAEEIAASDAKVDQRIAAENAQLEESRAKTAAAEADAAAQADAASQAEGAEAKAEEPSSSAS